jgi:CheY-like chemotaxis protein
MVVRGHTVLLVDDDAPQRNALGMLLEGQGFDITVASDGGEAFEKLRAGLRPCVVVLDLLMDGMSGWRFRRLQMSDPELATIPVVVVSGHPDAKAAASGLGAIEVLPKPALATRLLALVDRHCPRRHAAS